MKNLALIDIGFPVLVFHFLPEMLSEDCEIFRIFPGDLAFVVERGKYRADLMDWEGLS